MANEKRLIDAETVIRKIRNANCAECNVVRKIQCSACWVDDVVSLLEDAPTVDAVEVVHGRWMWDVETHGDPMYGIDEDYGYRCSECYVWADEYGVDGDIYGEPPTPILHYCPNCGAKMDGERKDNE